MPRIQHSADPIRHEGEKISERSEAWAGVSFANRASGQISHWIGHWKRGRQAQNAGIYGKKKWRRGWDSKESTICGFFKVIKSPQNPFAPHFCQ